jgi:Leucine Rich repeat
MGAWGTTTEVGSMDDDNHGTKSSCHDLLVRLERNDPTLTTITILPMKSFTDQELNRISNVFENAKEILHLQSLNASGHTVSPSALRRFGTAIISLCNSGYSNLSSLAIGDSTMGDNGIQALVDGFTSVHDETMLSKCTLTTLDLSYKDMTLTGFFAVASICQVCTNITHLNVSRNRLTYDKSVTLPIADTIFENIVHFDLSDCQIDTKFTRRIFPYLEYSDHNGSNNSNVSAEKPIEAPKDKKRRKKNSVIKNTRTILLHNNPIGDKGFRELLKLNRLDGLYVSNCQLTDVAMLSFTTTASSSITECMTLDISNNKAITATGMTVLGDSLKRRFISVLLPKLCHLNISGNESIGTDGIQAILTGLAGRTLHTCDFSETNCSGHGALLAIVAAQKEYCCTIQSLRLYNNHVGSNGFYKISEILSEILLSSELHTLDLSCNNAGQASVAVLLKAVLDAVERSSKKNRKSTIPLKCIIVGGNHGGFDVEAIVKQIHTHRPDIDIARDKKVRS